jgi:hypothetical protein
MRGNWIWLTVIWLVLPILAGCNQGVTPEIKGVSSPPPASTQVGDLEVLAPNATPLPETEDNEDHMARDEMPSHSPTLDPVQQKIVQTAKEDLTRRLSIALEEVLLADVEVVAWPDASLGCPQAGMTYEYHTDMEQFFMLCDSAFEENNPKKDTDKSVDDGWPNQTKDGDVIISRPTK